MKITYGLNKKKLLMASFTNQYGPKMITLLMVMVGVYELLPKFSIKEALNGIYMVRLFKEQQAKGD